MFLDEKKAKQEKKHQAENKLDAVQKDSGKIQDDKETVKQQLNKKGSGHEN